MNAEFTYEQQGTTVTVMVNGRAIGSIYFARLDEAELFCQDGLKSKTVEDVVTLMASSLAWVATEGC